MLEEFLLKINLSEAAGRLFVNMCSNSKKKRGKNEKLNCN